MSRTSITLAVTYIAALVVVVLDLFVFRPY